MQSRRRRMTYGFLCVATFEGKWRLVGIYPFDSDNRSALAMALR